MATVLYIKANPKSDADSITFQMSEAFVEEYRRLHPEDQVITLDLYREGIRFLTGEDLNDMFSGAEFEIRDYARQFAAADKYIFAAPLWNLSIPTILKAYIDYISFAGISFRYTENGAEGLLKNKKAAYIVARGGVYSQPPMSDWEMGERYLRAMLAFLGITDVVTITCENTEVLQGDDLKRAIEASVQKAREEAAAF